MYVWGFTRFKMAEVGSFKNEKEYYTISNIFRPVAICAYVNLDIGTWLTQRFAKKYFCSMVHSSALI